MRRAPGVVALVIAAALASCRAPEVKGDLSVQFDDYPDVPVPATMVRDREHSLRLEAPVIGSVVNVYRGEDLTPEALTDHFVHQMPGLGWRLVSRFDRRETILVFVKDRTLAFIGVGLDGGRPTLSVLVGALGGREGPAAVQRN